MEMLPGSASWEGLVLISESLRTPDDLLEAMDTSDSHGGGLSDHTP